MQSDSPLMLRRRTSGIVVRRMGPELLILDSDANLVHSLNQTASLIWENCNECRSAEELAQLLVERFDVASHTAVRDVESTLDTLLALKLCTN